MQQHPQGGCLRFLKPYHKVYLSIIIEVIKILWAGQKVILTLPQNVLIDLSTFTMDFKGYSQHNGSYNGSTVGPANYCRFVCQTRFFPRNTQILIETFEIKIEDKQDD